MAKKAVKKQSSTAKPSKAPAKSAPAKKVAVKKPASANKKPVAKVAPAPKKAAAKPAKAVDVKKSPSKAVKKPVAKPEPAKKVKAVEPKTVAPKIESAKNDKNSKAEKKVKEALPEKVAKAEKHLKVVTEDVENTEAPKKEKKIKFDRTGMSEDQIKWTELHEKYKQVKAAMYSISAQFEAKTPITHKIFGWGFILSNEYDRLEVLFEDGKRMLISNRKL